jgi:hypothetical protein
VFISPVKANLGERFNRHYLNFKIRFQAIGDSKKNELEPTKCKMKNCQPNRLVLLMCGRNTDTKYGATRL